MLLHAWALMSVFQIQIPGTRWNLVLDLMLVNVQFAKFRVHSAQLLLCAAKIDSVISGNLS